MCFRNKLAYKMLPRIIVKKMKTGEKLAEYFDCVSIFFSTVVDFQIIRAGCSPLEVCTQSVYSVVPVTLHFQSTAFP